MKPLNSGNSTAKPTVPTAVAPTAVASREIWVSYLQIEVSQALIQEYIHPDILGDLDLQIDNFSHQQNSRCISEGALGHRKCGERRNERVYGVVQGLEGGGFRLRLAFQSSRHLQTISWATSRGRGTVPR